MRRYQQNPQSPATIIGGEAAVITPEDTRMHILNAVGTRIWELCAGEGCTVEELKNRLRVEFDGDDESIQQDTQAFLDAACEAGFLTLTEL